MLAEILVPVAVFTALVLGLAGLVMLARSRLEPAGLVAVVVNGERRLDLAAGDKLLFALADAGIHLPAPCGGRGTCGQCRLRVTSGGGALLPTEEPHIGPEEAAAGFRLACMQKLRGPLTVEIDAEDLQARRFRASVESCRSIAAFLREIVLLPESPLEFRAGDYLLVEAPAHRIAFADFDIAARFRGRWDESGFFSLRSHVREAVTRAYSLASPPQSADRLTLVIRIALPPPTAPAGTPPGKVSSWLYGLKPGDSVWLRGPFGEFHARDSDREMVFIGGGAGIAPLCSIILDQLARDTGRKMSLWYGARDADDLCYVDEFRAAAERHGNFDYRVALSSARPGSGWRGHRGFIHAVVRSEYLQSHPAPAAIEYYLCGPPLMSAAVLEMLAELGVPRENVFFDDFGA